MSRYSRITVKIGSNVLTRPDGTLDVTRMSALVDQIAELRRHGIEVIVISSGAVACGRSELRSPSLAYLDDVSARQLFSAVGQARLINRYSDLFATHGLTIGQVLTMKECFSTRTHYLTQRNCMMVMLAHGVIPVVNENDTVSVTELMFTDNDELSGLVAAMMDCDALIILSNIDGIYDGDPSLPSSKVISRILSGDDFSRFIRTSRSGFGRGGMTTKYNIARKVADEGIDVIIANGKTSDILPGIVLDPDNTISTTFAANPMPSSTMKRWIAHSEGFAKGSITLDDNAVKAVTDGRVASVLPVGVTGVSGDFEKDDLVRVLAPDGTHLGVGRSNYSATEAREAIGRHNLRPIIHYDYLYIN